MFRITMGKGFQVTFENGYTVSVQFGPGNYCSNDMRGFSMEAMREAGERGSSTAETAFFGPDGNLLKRNPDDADVVQGHQRTSDVLALMVYVASLPVAA